MSPLPSVTFRSELDPVVRKELDQLDSELTAYLLQEHDEDGRHTVITAQRLTVTGPVTVIGGPVTLDGVPLTMRRVAELESAVVAADRRIADLDAEVTAMRRDLERFMER